jgi:hypothetical protein
MTPDRWYRKQRCRPGTLLAALIAVSGATGAAHAQVLEGRVVSVDTLSVIRGAFVQVYAADSVRVGAAMTDAEGRYEIQLQRPGGPFIVRVDAYGFHRDSLSVAKVRADERLTLEDFVLDPAPIVMDQVSVEVQQSRRTPGREWVRRNQLHGTGTFLAGITIATDAPHSLGDYIADRTRLWVRYDARGRPTLVNPAGSMSRCVEVMVNRWPLSRTGFMSIDDIPHEDIAAIEIYEHDRDRPPGYSFEGRQGCGLIQVWLWNSW